MSHAFNMSHFHTLNTPSGQTEYQIPNTLSGLILHPSAEQEPGTDQPHPKEKSAPAEKYEAASSREQFNANTSICVWGPVELPEFPLSAIISDCFIC